MPLPPITPLADYDVDVVVTNTITTVVPGGSQIYYNVLDYGVDPTGASDNTAAYTAIFALASSGVMFFPPGLYMGQINFPSTGDTRSQNWDLLGSGIYSTFLMPPAANTTVLWRGERVIDGVIQGVTIGGFSVKAHAAGSTGTAIDVAGFRSCLFHDIGYASNAGGDFASLFHLSAGQFRCYNNVIQHVVVDNGTVPNTGPATVILFDSKNDAGVPQGLNFTANGNYIRDCFIFNGAGTITTVFDCLRSSGTFMENCFIENNGTALAVIPGTGMTMMNSSFESDVLGGLDDIVKYMSIPGEGAGNNTLLINCGFSDMPTLNIPAACSDNLWIKPFLSVPLVVNDLGTNNLIIDAGGRILSGTLLTRHLGSLGTAPAVSATNLGAGGTASLFAGSTDTDGIIVLVFGATVSLDGVVTVTFAKPYSQFPSVMICPATGPVAGWTLHAAKPLQLSAISNTAFDVVWANGTVPNPGDEFHINYHVKGLPD